MKWYSQNYFLKRTIYLQKLKTYVKAIRHIKIGKITEMK